MAVGDEDGAVEAFGSEPEADERGATWMPSQMSSAKRRSSSRTVPRMPGSRWSSGRMALKVWVARGGSGGDGGEGFGGGGVGVAEGDADAEGGGVADEVEGGGSSGAKAPSGWP